ncbi:hypothetical protein [Aeromonas caviae]|uniref:hypothetical protein n=1 Tax=Aeromonas caviae TaxID=648 RepID=UPI00142DFF23|nr:hypothetical protein [Aeromonas caviae]
MSTTPLKMEFLRRRVSRLKGMFLWLYTVYINPRRLEALPNQDSQKARFPLSSFALSLFVVLPLSLLWFAYNLYHFFSPSVPVSHEAADVASSQGGSAPAGSVGRACF